MKDLRRIVVAAVIGSFSLAALMGILALLGAGDFGEGEARILLTTVVVGIESIAVLCYLALADHRFAAVGWIGAAVSIVATLTALTMVWDDGDSWQLLLTAIVVAATLAQASLLIALVDGTPYGAGLAGTLGAAAVVALMLVNVIVREDLSSDDYWRVFGVVAILDVLGTVVLMALGAFRRAATRSAGIPRSEQPAHGVVLGAAVQARVEAAAQERGTTAEDVVNEALADYFARG